MYRWLKHGTGQNERRDSWRKSATAKWIWAGAIGERSISTNIVTVIGAHAKERESPSL